MTRVLALDASMAACSVAMLDGDAVVERGSPSSRGAAAALPRLIAAVLEVSPGPPGAVAVTVGPGSFTGLRAALSLAQGLAMGWDVPLVGVSVAEAMAGADTGGRPLWVALDNRRGRVFLDRGGVLSSEALDALPLPAVPVALAGDAAHAVAARLASRDFNVLLTAMRQPTAAGVARAGLRRLGGALPPLAAVPLYVDPPEARPPAAGLRPCPA